ncbi:UBX domain-containing protein 2A [Dendrobates tinctorius]|uniref:UBX domain-containing protein 2A n=1 Tax=Dendrobates tinctorius TaxID=92724 RepID=UPI003CC933A4
MREADKTDAMKPQDRIFRMAGRSSERKRCDSFVNSLFEEAEDAGVLNASPEDEAEVVIKMWKNGFTINDGYLRDYSDAANRQFMDSMKKGELPPELHKTFAKKELSVNVEDRKGEEYMIRKKRVDPFSGQGHRLGSATPNVITKAGSGLENGDDESLPIVELDAGESATNVKIWLADGKRIVQKFNMTHRISDVRNFVERIPCKSEKIPFMLATSFPLRNLLDETLTIEEARLQNAVLVQRVQKSPEPFRNC